MHFLDIFGVVISLFLAEFKQKRGEGGEGGWRGRGRGSEYASNFGQDYHDPHICTDGLMHSRHQCSFYETKDFHSPKC